MLLQVLGVRQGSQKEGGWLPCLSFPACTMKGWAEWSPGRFLRANRRNYGLGGEGVSFRLRGL